MGRTLRFDAVLEAEGAGHFFRVPPEVALKLGPRKRPPVVVTVAGVTYRTTIAVYGGQALVGVRLGLRQAAGLAVGDRVSVAVSLDEQERAVEVPPDLADALASNEAAAARFDRLAYAHQKEFVEWVESARRAHTRQKRVAGVIEQLSAHD